MRIKVGGMGSAAPERSRLETGRALVEKAERRGRAIEAEDVVLRTGATTGMVDGVGKAAHGDGGFQPGLSPASNEVEHVELYKLPLDACDTIVYTGFGLKGRNVVLVRSCDIALFVAGAMGSLNEFTIAHDERKIIGCLTGTGGVADEVDYLLQKFGKRAVGARVFQNEDPEKLLDDCVAGIQAR